MAVPTRDHIYPRSKGGTLAQGKALECERCNGKRGSRTLASLRSAGDQRAVIAAAFMERQPEA
jgi:5-methylcytosine-specific restriction endonuclease McrA